MYLKKIKTTVSTILAVLIIGFGLFFVTSQPASAQQPSQADLQQMINDLLSQVAVLQDMLASMESDLTDDFETCDLVANRALSMAVGNEPVDLQYDISGDGRVTAGDALELLRMHNDLIPITPQAERIFRNDCPENQSPTLTPIEPEDPPESISGPVGTGVTPDEDTTQLTPIEPDPIPETISGPVGTGVTPDEDTTQLTPIEPDPIPETISGPVGTGVTPDEEPTTSNCYDQSNVGTIGQEAPCRNMLIVDREMMRNAEPINGGRDRGINHNGTLYTFGDSDRNIFTGQVLNMSALFQNDTNFHSPIGYWDVSNVRSMGMMFSGATRFDRAIGDWDVSNVNSMQGMFSGATRFDRAIGDWDVSNVTNMSEMFISANSFNRSVNSWDVSNVNNMAFMFAENTMYDRPLDRWDTSSVTNMDGMFENATRFNRSLRCWDVSNVRVAPEEPASFAEGSALQDRNLPRWGTSGC